MSKNDKENYQKKKKTWFFVKRFKIATGRLGGKEARFKLLDPK